MRLRRDKAAHALPEWEDMRALASQIKEHVLANLDTYLGQFEAAAKANGIVVHSTRCCNPNPTSLEVDYSYATPLYGLQRTADWPAFVSCGPT
jgi:hypothetical protein